MRKYAIPSPYHAARASSLPGCKRSVLLACPGSGFCLGTSCAVYRDSLNADFVQGHLIGDNICHRLAGFTVEPDDLD